MNAQIAEAKELAQKSSGVANERAIDEYIDYANFSIYQDATHSMASLGMIAPLYETMFFQAFQTIRTKFFAADFIPQGHRRSVMTNPTDFWDCHRVATGRDRSRPAFVPGIYELADAVDLTSYLSEDLRKMLEALFGYRNKMFHCGFEWPKNECQEFAKRIQRENGKHGFPPLRGVAMRSRGSST